VISVRDRVVKLPIMV